jgi:hypothetical protein
METNLIAMKAVNMCHPSYKSVSLSLSMWIITRFGGKHIGRQTDHEVSLQVEERQGPHCSVEPNGISAVSIPFRVSWYVILWLVSINLLP